MGLRGGRWTISIYSNKAWTNPNGPRKSSLDLHISPDEFDAVAEELSHALDYYGVPEREKGEVLAAFAAHKNEVTAGYFAAKLQKFP
jgi:hemoglobin